MSKELFWLTITLGVTSLLASPQVLNRAAVRGSIGAMRNPSPTDERLARRARRAQKAQANAAENLVAFAPAILVARLLELM